MTTSTNISIVPYGEKEWIAHSSLGSWIFPGVDSIRKAELLAHAFFQTVTNPQAAQYTLQENQRRLVFASNTDEFRLSAGSVSTKEMMIIKDALGTTVQRAERPAHPKPGYRAFPELPVFQELSTCQKMEVLEKIERRKDIKGAGHCLWVIGHSKDLFLVKAALRALLAIGGVPLSSQEQGWLDYWMAFSQEDIAVAAMQVQWLGSLDPYNQSLRDRIVHFLKTNKALNNENQCTLLKLLAHFNWTNSDLKWVEEMDNSSKELENLKILLLSADTKQCKKTAQLAWENWVGDDSIPHGVHRSAFFDRLRDQWASQNSPKHPEIRPSHRIAAISDPHLPPEGNLYHSEETLCSLLLGREALEATSNAPKSPCFFVFKAKHYEEAYLRGKARYRAGHFQLESRLPMRCVEAIVLPKAYEHDILLIQSDQRIEEVARSLRHEELRNLPPDTVYRLRCLLTAQVKIHYREAGLENSLASCTQEQIQASSEHYHALRGCAAKNTDLSHARETIDPARMYALLTTANHAELARELAALHEAIGLGDEPLTIFQKMSDRIVGQHRLYGRGGFGLQTEIKVGDWSQERVRLVLRLAALTPDLDPVKKVLKLSDEEVKLIECLVHHQHLFNGYVAGLKRRLTLQQLHATLKTAHQEFASVLSYADFNRLLWVLYLAGASTRTAVHTEHANVYRPYWEVDRLQRLDFTSLEFLRTLRAEWKKSISLPSTTKLPKLLLEGTDAEFAQGLETAALAIGIPVETWNKISNNHGRLKLDPSQRLTLWQHTADVVAPSYGLGGFGLRTDGIAVAGWNPAEVRKVLRLAALYHDSGKATEESTSCEREGHEERSAACVRTALARHLPQDQVDIVAKLIEINSLFGACFLKKIRPHEVYAKLNEAYEGLRKKSIVREDFIKLAWILYLADASTLPQLYENRGMYEHSLAHLNGDFYQNEQWLEELNLQVQNKRKKR